MLNAELKSKVGSIEVLVKECSVLYIVKQVEELSVSTFVFSEAFLAVTKGVVGFRVGGNSVGYKRCPEFCHCIVEANWSVVLR